MESYIKRLQEIANPPPPPEADTVAQFFGAVPEQEFDKANKIPESMIPKKDFAGDMTKSMNSILTGTIQEQLASMQQTSPILRSIMEKTGYNRPLVGTVIPANTAEYIPEGAENEEYLVMGEGGIVTPMSQYKRDTHVMLIDEQAPNKPIQVFERTPEMNEGLASFGRLLGLGMAGDTEVAGGLKVAQSVRSAQTGNFGDAGTLSAGGVVDDFASPPVITDLTPGNVPVINGSPAIVFPSQKIPVYLEGEKGVGKIGPGDIGKYWDDDYKARYGKQGDPNNPADFDLAINTATAEAKFQLQGIESGKGWYDEDIKNTWDVAGEAFPELNNGLVMPPNEMSARFTNGEDVSSEALRILTTAIAAPLSFGNRPKPNFNTALKVLDGWLATGKIPDMNPETGKLWTMRNVSSQSLRLLQHMVNKLGVEGSAEWLMTPHTVLEIRNMRREANIWNDSQSMSIPGSQNDTKLGAFILGRKGGPFFLNLNGVEDTTADLWFTRTWNRQFGRMTGPNLPANEVIINQPRAIERGLMKEWNQEVSSKLGETEQDSQAILWYFEQQLFNSMGQTSAKPSKFSDGARQFRDERGGRRLNSR